MYSKKLQIKIQFIILHILNDTFLGRIIMCYTHNIIIYKPKTYINLKKEHKIRATAALLPEMISYRQPFYTVTHY